MNQIESDTLQQMSIAGKERQMAMHHAGLELGVCGQTLNNLCTQGFMAPFLLYAWERKRRVCSKNQTQWRPLAL